jgi:hypothetical protein
MQWAFSSKIRYWRIDCSRPPYMRIQGHSLGLSLLAAAGFLPFACTGNAGSNHSPAGAGEAGEGARGSVAGAAGADAGGAGGAGAWKVPCTAPELNTLSGLVICKEGYSHRPSAVACRATLERHPAGGGGAGGMGGDDWLPRADGTIDCSDDSQLCNAFDLGFCADLGGGGGTQLCHSGCETDADCGAGQACLCTDESEHGGRCVEARCATDTDCGPGYRCALVPGGCADDVFICQKAEDDCRADADCSPRQCVLDREEDRRVCDARVLCGRPFIVAASPRVAPATSNGDWSDSEPSPNVEALATHERATEAQRWTKLGQLEHASIAAFARFSMQLLALGAPPALVDECTRAIADEAAHARRCFTLASAYAGHAVGPGPLDIEGSLTPIGLLEVVDLVIAEGCWGETGAALEALRESERAEDPVIATTFRQIAEDEQRHAELAFRFLRWAFDRDQAAVTERLSASQQSPEWRDHPARSVVTPCFDALIATAQLAA